MEFQQMIMMLPGSNMTELLTIQDLTKDLTPNQQQLFFSHYQGKRKDPQTIMLLTIVGFFGVAGIQRFVLGDTGMGICYLFTCGFCGIGTIMDLVNNERLTTEFNQDQAIESAEVVSMMTSNS